MRGGTFRYHGFTLVAHGLALALFVHGFLLARITLKRASYDAATSTSSASDTLPSPSSPVYDRLVLIVVDALRYDFVVDDGRYQYSGRNRDMPFLRSFVGGTTETDAGASSFSVVARYVADAPTTTTQRIKSMMTGSLPVFFDVSSAFSPAPVEEDSLVDQLCGRRRGSSSTSTSASTSASCVFMGDATWEGLFGDRQAENDENEHSAMKPFVFHSFPCYNIMDLHSVDDGVAGLLVPTVARGGWDVVVAHYLGVDHAGHAYGVDSGEMRDKLREIDDGVRKVVEALVEEEVEAGGKSTLVVVVGDHGQTVTGDHGGGSPEEVDSVLVGIDIGGYRRYRERKDGEENGAREKRKTSLSAHACVASCTCGVDGNQCVPDVTQIDFVPTLAGLMGVPVPFVNLGKVSEVVWSALAAGRDGGHAEASLVGMLRENARQVHLYLTTYASRPGARLPAAMMAALERTFAELAGVTEPGPYVAYLELAEALARDAWTQFREGWMVAGCIVFVGAVVFHVGALVFDDHDDDGRRRIGFPPPQPMLPWLVNLLHPVGIFSFFFLLREGTYSSWIVVLAAAIVYWPRRDRPAATTGLVLAGAACLLVSTVGLQSHSGFGFWQRLTVHTGDDEGEEGISHETSASASPYNALAVHYVLPTLILATIFHAYTASRGLLRGTETINRVYLAAGTLAMLAYHGGRLQDRDLLQDQTGVDAFGVSQTSDRPSVTHISAQICYACILATLILATTTRALKRLSRKAFLAVLAATLALLVSLISPVASPLVLLGIFAQLYGINMILKAQRPARVHDDPDDTVCALAACLAAVQIQAFYVSGHLCEFSGLLYTAAFVGQKDYHAVQGGLLLGFDTCGCVLVVIVVGALFLSEMGGDGVIRKETGTGTGTKKRGGRGGRGRRGRRDDDRVQRLLYLQQLPAAMNCAAAMLSAGIQRR